MRLCVRASHQKCEVRWWRNVYLLKSGKAGACLELLLFVLLCWDGHLLTMFNVECLTRTAGLLTLGVPNTSHRHRVTGRLTVGSLILVSRKNSSGQHVPVFKHPLNCL